MRRKRAIKRGRIIPILAAGGVCYLIGGWHTAALRTTELSAAESIALRFPQDWNDASPGPGPDALDASPAATTTTTTMAAMATTNVADNAQLALFSPEPMFPKMIPQAIPQGVPQAGPPATLQMASAEVIDSAPAPVSRLPQAPVPRAAQPASQAKPVAAAARRPTVNRPGYMLNDAQIASIKERLHLTPDQEQMWPAVEAALRNIAYTRAQEARGGYGAPTSSMQAAAVDPNAVQGLKSAAVPLIMSFNAEQKEEVRNLAHVMGLDQLASQF